MTKREIRKVEKVLERIGNDAAMELKIATNLQAKYVAAGDEENASQWSSVLNGMFMMLQALEMINTNEYILLVEYSTKKVFETADEIKKGAA